MKISNFLVHFTLFAFLHTSHVAAETLYGLTVSGSLYDLNYFAPSAGNVYGTPIRTALPYGQYTSLLAKNGSFYSFDNLSRKLYKFGLTSGDEVVIGTTNYTQLGGMAIRPSDEQVFITVGNLIGMLSLNSGTIYSLIDPVHANGSTLGRITGISFFADGTNRIIIGGSPNQWNNIGTVNLQTSIVPSMYFQGCCFNLNSIAIGQHGEGSWIAASHGTQFPYTSGPFLIQYADPYPSPPSGGALTPLGTIFNLKDVANNELNIVGLSFSFHSNPNLQKANEWEPIRMLLD